MHCAKNGPEKAPGQTEVIWGRWPSQRSTSVFRRHATCATVLFLSHECLLCRSICSLPHFLRQTRCNLVKQDYLKALERPPAATISVAVLVAFSGQVRLVHPKGMLLMSCKCLHMPAGRQCALSSLTSAAGPGANKRKASNMA